MRRDDLTVTISAAIAGVGTALWGQPILLLTACAAAADLATGVWKASALRRVESQRLGRGLYKLVTLTLIGCGLAMIGRLSAPALMVCNAFAAAFFTRELLSNVENLYVVGQAYGVEWPAVRLLVRLLRLNEDKLLAEAGKQPVAPDTPADTQGDPQ